MIFLEIKLRESIHVKGLAPQDRDRFIEQEARPDNFGLWLPHPPGKDGVDPILETCIPWNIVQVATRKRGQQTGK